MLKLVEKKTELKVSTALDVLLPRLRLYSYIWKISFSAFWAPQSSVTLTISVCIPKREVMHLAAERVEPPSKGLLIIPVSLGVRIQPALIHRTSL